MQKAIANYKMTFNEGRFEKNKEYIYEYVKDNFDNLKKVFVTTEEGKKQEFLFSEFNVLFTILT